MYFLVGNIRIQRVNLKFPDNFLFSGVEGNSLWTFEEIIAIKTRRKKKITQKTRNRLLSLWLDWYNQSVQDFSRGKILRLVLLRNRA